MLLRFGSYQLFNLESLPGITYENGDIIVTVPSADSENGYRDIYLGVTSPSYAVKVMDDISNIYKQYVTNSTGELFIPPKVYTINSNKSSYLKGSDIFYNYSEIDWDSQKISNGKLYINVKLRDRNNPSRDLWEGRDYTAQYPLYRGDGIVHTVVYSFKKSNTKYNFLFYASYKGRQ